MQRVIFGVDALTIEDAKSFEAVQPIEFDELTFCLIDRIHDAKASSSSRIRDGHLLISLLEKMRSLKQYIHYTDFKLEHLAIQFVDPQNSCSLFQLGLLGSWNNGVTLTTAADFVNKALQNGRYEVRAEPKAYTISEERLRQRLAIAPLSNQDLQQYASTYNNPILYKTHKECFALPVLPLIHSHMRSTYGEKHPLNDIHFKLGPSPNNGASKSISFSLNTDINLHWRKYRKTTYAGAIKLDTLEVSSSVTEVDEYSSS
jgi:hypothetical protein